MTDILRIAQIADAAERWNGLRLLALAVSAQRSSFQCEYAEADDLDTNAPGVPVCWRQFEYDHRNGDVPLNPSDWCDACVTRQGWYLALREIVKLRGAAERRLQRLCAGRRDK